MFFFYLFGLVAAQATCSHIGDCGRSYQVCCAGFAKKGYPCGCHLVNKTGGGGGAGPTCGDCGKEYEACCIGFKLKGYPCECDVAAPSIFLA